MSKIWWWIIGIIIVVAVVWFAVGRTSTPSATDSTTPAPTTPTPEAVVPAQ